MYERENGVRQGTENRGLAAEDDQTEERSLRLYSLCTLH